MSRRETWQERAAREEMDDDLSSDLLEQPDPFQYCPSFKKVTIMREKYSIRWILYYAQARMRGVSCMYISSCYANDRVFGLLEEGEHHYVSSTKRDGAMLYFAQQYMAKHGLYQKPK